MGYNSGFKGLSHADPSGRAVWIMGLRPLASWDCGSESRWGHRCLSVVSVVCCQVEVSATSWSLVQRSLTEWGVSECDRESSIMRTPWPTGGCWAMVNKNRSHKGPVPPSLCCCEPDVSSRNTVCICNEFHTASKEKVNKVAKRRNVTTYG